MSSQVVHRALTAANISPASCALALLGAICGCVLDTEPLGPNSGPEGYLPKFASTAQLVPSQIVERDGNVGIGTMAPNSNLHVGANSTGRAAITAEATTENAYLILKSAGDTATLVNRNDGTFRINHAGTSADAHLVITTSGDVGIGTATPQSHLQVSGGYLQLAVSGGSAPPATDCNQPGHVGRMIVQGMTGFEMDSQKGLYVCIGMEAGPRWVLIRGM